MKQTASKLKLLCSMGIFGTVGLFVRFIPMESSAIAMFRGLMGFVFLLLVILVTGKTISGRTIWKFLPVLLLSGAAMGFNWILLFESYRYTTVATATMCYYLAPAFVMLLSPLVGERLTGKKLLCILCALVGMVFVSGLAQGGLPEAKELKGILFGIGAAALYATVMLLAKGLSPVSAYDKTLVQLAVAAVVIAPYILLTGGFDFSQMASVGWAHLAVVGILHTGVAYALYFGSMGHLPSQTVALFSYLDPVIAVVLSALVLKEGMSLWSGIGAVLIIGSAVFGEIGKKS